MKLVSLHVERRPSYDDDYPNQMVGTVRLEGTTGKMEVVLSNPVLAEIFTILRANVQSIASRNAAQVANAVDVVNNEQLAIEDGQLTIEMEEPDEQQA